jgi:hypothetical protein
LLRRRQQQQLHLEEQSKAHKLAPHGQSTTVTRPHHNLRTSSHAAAFIFACRCASAPTTVTTARLRSKAAPDTSAPACADDSTAAASLQWRNSGILQVPGILWASGDERLLSWRGLTRVKQRKRERFARPLVVVPVKKRVPRAAAQQVQVVEATGEEPRACSAADANPVVVYKPVEEVIEVVECEDVSTIAVFIVMHNGKRVRATFKRSDTLQHLRDHIAALTPQQAAVFSLWGGRPRALLTNMSQLLTAGNVMQAPVQQRVPNAVLQAAVRRLVARERYLHRLETEASVMKLSATESRLRRLTEDMRNHSCIMQEVHEQEVKEEARQAQLLAVIEEAVAQKKRQERRMSRASALSGSHSKGSGGKMEDDEFCTSSEYWDSDASHERGASDADDEDGPGTPARTTAAEDLSAQTPPARVPQLTLSPKALQRLHTQVAGLHLLSPLRRRILTNISANSAAALADAQKAPSSSHKTSPSSDQLPQRLCELSPRDRSRARAVSDAERLKRMWSEQRAVAQLRPEQLKSLAPVITPMSTGATATISSSRTTHVIPSVTAIATTATEPLSPMPDYDDVTRFSYRSSTKQLSESERSRRRLHM